MLFNEEGISFLELKRQLPSVNQLLRACVSFANRDGGRIAISVEDSGKIVGVKVAEARLMLESLGESIFRSTTPSIIPNIFIQRFKEKLVVTIEISDGMQNPYYVTSERISKGTYVRVGRSTLRAGVETIEKLKWQSRGRCFDEQPIFSATLEDLDQSAIIEFLKSRGYKERLLFKALPSLREYKLVYDDSHKVYPTVGAILLFGTDPRRFFPEATTMISEFKNNQGREISASI